MEKKNNRIKIEKIAILGFGLEGKSVLKFLRKSPQFKKSDISVLDKKFDKNYLKNLEQFDIIFRSPGVPYNLPEIQKAVKKGVNFSGSTQLFFEGVKKIGCQIIGITGTKGKGTTSTLLYKILKAAKKDVHLAGNIGKPAIEILSKLKKNSVIILELSSFQLWDLNCSLDIAVVLDVFPDHLDVHKNFKEYINAKSNIAKKQKGKNKIFYFSNNKYSNLIAQKSPAKKIAVNSEHSNEFANLNCILKIPGIHNFKNALMAATIAKNLNISKKNILKTISNYRGLEHRMEFVRCISLPLKSRKQCNINFYNDSASTNPQTATAAIRSFPNKNLILIAGGKDKNLDYSPFTQALKNSNAKLVILFGENKHKIAKAILYKKYQIVSNKYKVILVKDLKNAINLAHKTAKFLVASSCPFVIILFSPASASFDMFKNYADRGKKFKKLVKILK